MKISYRNTALSFLENPRNFSFHTPDSYSKPTTEYENLKMMNALIDQFSEQGFSDFFSKKIQYITQPFYEAYWKSRDKLRDIVLTTEIDDSGTFIIKWPHHTQTIFYFIKSNGNPDDWEMEAFYCMFTKASCNDTFGLDVLIYIGKEFKEEANYVWKGFTDQGRDMGYWISDLMLFQTFLKYADVETKVIEGTKKDKHIGVKYVNDTKNKIEILDSTYYKTISRTEGFGVRGHFRFQPYGPGLMHRRLQWISEYEKQGYTRKAKIHHIS